MQAQSTPKVVPLHPDAYGQGVNAESESATTVPDAGTRWDDACLVAMLLALDPVGLGGVQLLAAPGPVRDAWLALLEEHDPHHRPPRRLPHHADESRLLGGLDLSASLQSGRPVLLAGVLAELDGDLLVCPMAERLPRRTVSHLTQALDHGRVIIEREGFGRTFSSRFGLVAVDESDAEAQETGVDAALSERLAFKVSLHGVDWRSAKLAHDLTGGAQTQGDASSVEERSERMRLAREALPHVAVPDAVVGALVEAAAALGIASLRAPWWALQVARALAAWRGLDSPGQDEVVDAARLVLGPRATQLPQTDAAPDEDDSDAQPTQPQPPDPAAAAPDQPPEPPPPAGNDIPPPTEDEHASPLDENNNLQELTVAALQASLPAGLLAMLARQQGLTGGTSRSREASSRAGDRAGRSSQGRPIGIRAGTPGGGQRLSLIDTLRQAAPWQRIRSSAESRRIQVRPEDFRVTVREPRRPTTTVFVVDASGSNALNRLAEAKGAVEALLADCYVRRDRVAVVGFRGQSAETLLPPTRSLVRAKRSLAGLPGGGGTPMARALADSRALCEALLRKGETVSLVLLTDGKANVTLEGKPGREQAHADAIHAARQLALRPVRCLLIDTSPKPQAQARELALAMRARYIPLPQARSGEVGRIVRNSLAA